MAVGILIGKIPSEIPAFLNQFEIAKVSIPIAILIWIMIYPMMKVDFQSVKNVGKNPKGLFVTWIVNRLIKPFKWSNAAFGEEEIATEEMISEEHFLCERRRHISYDTIKKELRFIRSKS